MGVRLLFGRYSSVLHTPRDGFGVRATSYPLRVGFFPLQSKAIGGVNLITHFHLLTMLMRGDVSLLPYTCPLCDALSTRTNI